MKAYMVEIDENTVKAHIVFGAKPFITGQFEEIIVNKSFFVKNEILTAKQLDFKKAKFPVKKFNLQTYEHCFMKDLARDGITASEVGYTSTLETKYNYKMM